jgi:hypothetical protein
LRLWNLLTSNHHHCSEESVQYVSEFGVSIAQEFGSETAKTSAGGLDDSPRDHVDLQIGDALFERLAPVRFHQFHGPQNLDVPKGNQSSQDLGKNQQSSIANILRPLENLFDGTVRTRRGGVPVFAPPYREQEEVKGVSPDSPIVRNCWTVLFYKRNVGVVLLNFLIEQRRALHDSYV